MNMQADDDLAFASIPELGTRLRDGRSRAVDLARFFLDRLERLGPRFNAVVNLTADRALAEAKQADDDLAAGRDRGPLHGIPYGAKDLLAATGTPTTWGAEPYREMTFDTDATVVRRLREAGAVLVAKLAMVELAGGMGYRQANASLTGPGLNPWDVSRWSGGSSSGSGSAVAAGLVPFAIGTETWGSITTPASYCGLVGLRPTYGRVSRSGAMALAWTHDKIGPMARSAHDCGLVLNAIAGPDPADPSSSDLPFAYPPAAPDPGRPWRLAVLKGRAREARPEVRDHFERALEFFRSVGTIDEIELPDLPFGRVASTILSAECAAAFEDLLDSGEVLELTAPEDRIGGFADQAILATEYIRAQRLRHRLCRELDACLAPFDALLTVPTADTAPPLDRFGSGYSTPSTGGAGNVCGTPALVLPTGLSADGLPTSIQLDGPAYSEPTLLALGLAYQRATSWHMARPSLGD